MFDWLDPILRNIEHVADFYAKQWHDRYSSNNNTETDMYIRVSWYEGGGHAGTLQMRNVFCSSIKETYLC